MPQNAAKLVEQAESHLRLHVGASIADVSRALGVSERALRNAFYVVRGMSPTQAVRMDRLARVRQALCHAGPGSETVTGVATTFGFYELGRFAALYRDAFGEPPSATLREARRTSAA